MKIREKNQGDVAIVALQGNMMGICEADDLHNEIVKLLEQKKTKIVLDMTDVQWMGSLCLGAVMREIIHTRQKNGEVYLAALSRKVHRLFQITKLEGVVNIYPTVETAIRDFMNADSL